MMKKSSNNQNRVVSDNEICMFFFRSKICWAKNETQMELQVEQRERKKERIDGPYSHIIA